jgi:soluble lytic murein transglycosylase-like protein
MSLRRILAALFLASGFAAGAQAQQPVQPAVQAMSSADAERYREIFADERAGRFDKAKELFGELSDTSLKGYVLAEHLLSPHAKAPVSELVSWLDSYRDLPISERIYRLAVKRSTRKVKRKHHKTILMAVVTNIPAPAGLPRMRGGGYEETSVPDAPISSPQARAVAEQMTGLIKSDNPDAAMALVQPLIDGGQVPEYDIARLTQRVAQSYFTEGMDDKVLDIASRAADVPGARSAAPLLDWNAGLAAFRLGKYDEAAKHFEILAQVGSVQNGVRAGAAFWAARSHMRAGDPSRVVTLLAAAAREKPTFYGLIAEQVLGLDAEAGFTDPVLDQASFDRLMQVMPAHRAAALYQIGERPYVEREMERAFGEIDPKLDPAFAALARRVDAPSLELRSSETSASRGLILTGLFPVPQYEPDGGYTIDPSLVLAITRAESRFHPEAVSAAGARGLMQVEPYTADHMAGAGAASHLLNPTYNMTIGQRLVAKLLDMYNGNLVELCAAYNIGALKVSSWMAVREGKGDDALLFIESMHAQETRLYVKRVLTYHWMYRRRLGLDQITLGETAKGDWPIYRPPHQSAPPPPPAQEPGDNDGGDDAPTTSD